MESAASPNAAHARGIFANRTLNLRSIRAVGYDMDYTLVHYRVEPWERRAYEHTRQRLVARGWPVGHLTFVPDLAVRGLIIDTELGNVVKANRFGYVKRAHHGTALVPFEEQRKVYARVIVDLSKPRWEFLNTLFSLSEACLFMQLVEMLDARQLPEVLGYADLYRAVRESVDASHMEGRLKQEIAADPDTFVVLDPEVPLALLDQKYAGKKLLLITNSEWPYTASMMHYAFDRFLPEGTSWRDLFDLVIVGASKPGFFQGKREVFEVATEEGLLKPWYGKLREGSRYYGGHAAAGRVQPGPVRRRHPLRRRSHLRRRQRLQELPALAHRPHPARDRGRDRGRGARAQDGARAGGADDREGGPRAALLPGAPALAAAARRLCARQQAFRGAIRRPRWRRCAPSSPSSTRASGRWPSR